jgi:hypothetical protein
MKAFTKIYFSALFAFFISVFICRADGIPQCGDLINRAIKIEAVLLKYKKDLNGPVERTEHKVLNKNQVKLVKDLFNDPKNYAQNITDCFPEYGARFVFYFENNQKFQIDFCFRCGFMSGELDGKEVHGKFDDFTPMKDSLFKMFKEVFPKDSPYAVIDGF